MSATAEQARRDLDTLGGAVRSLENAARRAWGTADRADDYDRAKELEHEANAAAAAYRRLSEIMPRALDLLSAQERAYDHYVTEGGRDG